MRCGAAALALALSAAALPAGAAELLPAQSEIRFTTHQMGVPVVGRFARFDASIALDPRQPAAGSVTFTIDTGSARFPAAETEAEVVKPTWLDALKFPQARFRSTAIKSLGGGRFEVDGQLSIKGRVADVQVPVSLQQTGGTGTATGRFSVRRLAFGIGDGDWADTSLVADEVQVHFRLALTGLPPP